MFEVATTIQWGLIIVAAILIMGKVIVWAARFVGEAKEKPRLWKELAGMVVALYAFYAVTTTLKESYASPVCRFVSGIALFAWLIWTIYTIDEKRRERESKDLRFRYSPVFDDFPEEFKKFCEKHHIGATDEFARDAIIREMHRIEREERERAGQE